MQFKLAITIITVTVISDYRLLVFQKLTKDAGQ